jgi:hypothetical protein
MFRICRGTAAILLCNCAAAAFAGASGVEVVDQPFRADRPLPVAAYTVRAAPLALVADVPVDAQLAKWAAGSDWTFRWYPDVSWRVLAPSTYSADFEKSFAEVMDILINDEGKPLRFVISRGNKVAEVYSNDVR